MNKKQIGLNIKQKRLELGLSQAQLAELTQLSTVHISHIETGTGNMSLPSFLDICQVLQVTPNDILLGSYTIPPQSDISLRETPSKLSVEDQILLQEIYELLEKRNTHSS